MRVEKFVLVMILSGILISGTVVAVFVNTVVMQSSPVEISVQTDKPYYAPGETVTFKLIVDNPEIEFRVTDPNNGPQRMTNNMGEINIVKIPDFIDPPQAISDLSDPFDSYDLFKSIRTEFTYVATIHYGFFSNRDSPLTLTWDGMITARDVFFDNDPSFPATSGYYAIVPNFLYATNHVIQFNMDEGAIFYYDGLHAGININNNPDNNVSINLAIGTPPGTTGNITCELFTDLTYTEYSGQMVSNVTIPDANHYHNQTVVLRAGTDTNISFTIKVKIPDHGDQTGSGNWFQVAYFYALLVTPVGNYTFGLNGEWNGGWMNAQQY